jgi:hypothetical protein
MVPVLAPVVRKQAALSPMDRYWRAVNRFGHGPKRAKDGYLDWNFDRRRLVWPERLLLQTMF